MLSGSRGGVVGGWMFKTSPPEVLEVPKLRTSELRTSVHTNKVDTHLNILILTVGHKKDNPYVCTSRREERKAVVKITLQTYLKKSASEEPKPSTPIELQSAHMCPSTSAESSLYTF
jgi:hypothetical protein